MNISFATIETIRVAALAAAMAAHSSNPVTIIEALGGSWLTNGHIMVRVGEGQGEGFPEAEKYRPTYERKIRPRRFVRHGEYRVESDGQGCLSMGGGWLGVEYYRMLVLFFDHGADFEVPKKPFEQPFRVIVDGEVKAILMGRGERSGG